MRTWRIYRREGRLGRRGHPTALMVEGPDTEEPLEVVPAEALIECENAYFGAARACQSLAEELQAAEAKLDQLARWLYRDTDGNLRDEFPGGADTCEVLDQVLTEAGRNPEKPQL